MAGAAATARRTAPGIDVRHRRLRIATAVMAVAVAVHGADHMRRGVDVVSRLVTAAGTAQFVAVAVTVVLVFRRHRLAPAFAAWVGLIGGTAFAAVHLLPEWGALSDPFTGSVVGAGVTAFSWLTALFEIAADLGCAVAGFTVLRASGESYH